MVILAIQHDSTPEISGKPQSFIALKNQRQSWSAVQYTLLPKESERKIFDILIIQPGEYLSSMLVYHMAIQFYFLFKKSFNEYTYSM